MRENRCQFSDLNFRFPCGIEKSFYHGRIHPELRVPYKKVTLEVRDKPLALYDVSGPYTDPNTPVDMFSGIPKVREPWIERNPDLKEYRTSSHKDLPGFNGSHRFRKAVDGKTVTQLHYARKGTITPEMEFVAIREGLEPEFVRREVAEGRAIIPANVNHPEIGRAHV